MKILILAPSLNPHGGIRVIVEWANHLARRGHSVMLHVVTGGYQDWIDIAPEVAQRYGGHWSANDFDVVIATTPPLALDLDARRTSAKKFYLLQMAEHLFQPGSAYERHSIKSYNVNMPIIGISRWVESVLKREYGRKGPIYYIGNGVSEAFRPGEKAPALTVVVSDWEGYNQAKDVNAIGPAAARHLKQKYKARIVGWSSQPLRTMPEVPDDYYHRIDTATLANIFQRATFTIKASMYDARSTAPVEAMACGTTTARAIHLGDDDLYHGYNCLRCGYNLDALVDIAEKLVMFPEYRARLEANGLEYRRQWLDWGFWMDKAEDVITEKILASG